MTYYLNLYSPQTYEAFLRSDRSVTGFRRTHEKLAQPVQPGDRFICYMTKVSRWFGVLEVLKPRVYRREPDIR
jgi:predicted RNA-binding protein